MGALQQGANVPGQPTGRRRMHPDGVAALIAVIVAGIDVKDMPFTGDGLVEAFQRAVDRRQDQVLRMAHEYYKTHPIDFSNEVDWREGLRANSLNNLAKLDRANIR